MYEEILKGYAECADMPDRKAAELCMKKWDSIAKPIGGLGKFEKTVADFAAMTGDSEPDFSKKAVIVMCADNGVVKEGVTQTGPSVTVEVAESIAEGVSNVSIMADCIGADVMVMDMGMLTEAESDRVWNCSVAKGTGNIAEGPAMTREQACEAIISGIKAVETLYESGYRMIAMGEMGIGNTTTTSALASVLTGLDAEKVTGRGAGLDDESFERKKNVIKRAIEINRPDREDPIDMLSKLGGFDIAGLAGVVIGGALSGCAIVLDGVISAVAAVIASMICPESAGYVMASHMGREPSMSYLLDKLGVEPVIYGDMALGEGTGAVMFMGLMDQVMALYKSRATFDEIDMKSYERYDTE